MMWRSAPGSQGGLALVGVLGVMTVLGVLGVAAFRNVRTDIAHTGRDLARVRAEFAAESAVQWGLAEVARKRPGRAPFTLATHGPDGKEILDADARGADGEKLKLKSADVERMPGAKGGADEEGWIYGAVKGRDLSVSYAEREKLSFKVWYPNDSTLRIQGRGEADGHAAEVNLVSTLRDIAILMP